MFMRKRLLSVALPFTAISMLLLAGCVEGDSSSASAPVTLPSVSATKPAHEASARPGHSKKPAAGKTASKADAGQGMAESKARQTAEALKDIAAQLGTLDEQDLVGHIESVRAEGNYVDLTTRYWGIPHPGKTGSR